MKIICISGHAQNGKTTTANTLVKQLTNIGKHVKEINYADYLKFVAQKYYDWNGEKDEYGRSLLQQLGTDIVRNINSNFWVNIVEMTINTLFAPEGVDYVIIADARFPNEIDYWRRNDYDIMHIRVKRTGNFDDGLTAEQRLHPSEVSLDDYPAEIIIEAETVQDIEDSIDELIVRRMI